MRVGITILLAVFGLAASLPLAGLPGSAEEDREKARVEQAVEGLPLYFVEIHGQSHEDVYYHVRGSDKTLYFTREGITFSLLGKQQRWTVKLDFVDSNPEALPRGRERHDAVFSYFRGGPGEWKAGLSSYRKVAYEELWPGIDLVYSGSANQLKYEFIVKPGADPSRIRLAYRGATGLSVSEAGELEITTPVAEFEDARPYAYQDVGGDRLEVCMAYSLGGRSPEGAHTYGFRIGDYDPERTLVLDPAMVVYCGFIGGANWDGALDIAVDIQGGAFVAGLAESSEGQGFPVAVGPDLTANGLDDGFVAKVHPSGANLVYCGFTGGSWGELAFSIALDDQGSAYVAGFADSTENLGFPVVVGPDLTHNGDSDAFVAKVHPTGTHLIYCGYIGGFEEDEAWGVAVDSQGAAYVTGFTQSDETMDGFPVVIGPDKTHNGSSDAFVVKVPGEFPASWSCRMGTVNLGVSPAPAPVLTINASQGDAHHIVEVMTGSAIEVYMSEAPAGPLPGNFALYVWLGEPDESTVTPHPANLGDMCFPSPLSGGSPQPKKIWNNIGQYPNLGYPNYPSNPAPSVVFSKPTGMNEPITATFQGFILDNGSASSKPASITNAVILEVW